MCLKLKDISKFKLNFKINLKKKARIKKKNIENIEKI